MAIPYAEIGCNCPSCQIGRAGTLGANVGYGGKIDPAPAWKTTPFVNEASKKVFDDAMSTKDYAFAGLGAYESTTQAGRVMDRDYALAERAERLADRWAGAEPKLDPLSRIEAALDRLERAADD